MTDSESILERENARLKRTIAELRNWYEPPGKSLVQEHSRWWLGLDDYELVNLREALRAVSTAEIANPLRVMNSGDWVCQILNRLETAMAMNPPNVTAAGYRESARRMVGG